jgi:hypothetical protein
VKAWCRRRASADGVGVLDEQAAGLQNLPHTLENCGDLRGSEGSQWQAGNDVGNWLSGQTWPPLHKAGQLTSVTGKYLQTRKALAKMGGQPFGAFDWNKSFRRQPGRQQGLGNGTGARPQFQNTAGFRMADEARNAGRERWRTRAGSPYPAWVGDQLSPENR